MTQEHFEATLRKYLRARPFFPFVVEKLDSTVIVIEQPKVAFGGGAASYFDPDGNLGEFLCEDTREIRPAHAEASS